MTEAEVLAKIAHRVEAEGSDETIVVGIRTRSESERFFAFTASNEASVNEFSVFQIGSITKVFTSLLLLILQQKGLITIHDDAQSIINIPLPEKDGRAISLVDLSTHTSGLPRLPTNMRPSDLKNPYFDYTLAQLAEFLAEYLLTREIGSAFEYSNVGGGLLGLALGSANGSGYENAVKQELLVPFGLIQTDFSLSATMQKKKIVGYSSSLEVVPPWNFGVLQAAGGLWSSVSDLMILLHCITQGCNEPYRDMLGSALSIQKATPQKNLYAALGWMLSKHPTGTVAWHNGATGGYRSFIGYAPARQRGVVILSNTASSGLDALGLQLVLTT